MAAIQAAEPRGTRTWTAEEAGGYHYVVLHDLGGHGGDASEGDSVTRVLGPPFYDKAGVTAWVVPGVGTVPPGLVGAP